ncbi:hypothetical protein [Methanobacterium sp.]|uniref:hypothetical protein n=1 Tax=Methanobacterium sp. TaxID=2164 RepID=UPI001E03818A|nr:hypothetical protein [Methanobacterium sp.]MBI4813488.1 hypothetical protein [Methanobacterium sp.]MBI5460354.1 hypothetical protein [Methanobacterium sp.]
MSNENQVKWIESVDKDLIKLFETTEEYKAWQESLFAIIGYSSNEEIDEKLVTELLADHLNASFELQKGLGNARHKKGKMIRNELLLDNCGE